MKPMNQNCRQDTDSTVDREPQKIGLVNPSFQSECSHGLSFFERLILCGLDSKVQAARLRFSPGIHGLLGIVLAALVLAFAGSCASAQARDSETSHTRTTVVIFADRPMKDEQWSDLFTALREVLAIGGSETEPLGKGGEFVRGDSAAAGFRVQSAIVVYLHGDCNLEPLPRRAAYGVPLGWVRKVDGRIEPFAHVDCTRIGEVLGAEAQGMDADRRDAVMAGAIARVTVHEWIHIAAQSSSHADRGIEKARYGVADLVGGDDGPVARLCAP